MLQSSHLTTLDSQSVSGPGAQAQPYRYNQRDLLGDDWLEVDHRFASGLLSFKYDLGTETLATNYVQGQVTAELRHVDLEPNAADGPPASVLGLSQTQRSAVLRYNGDPSSQIHYSLAGYFSSFGSLGTSFDPRAGFVWTPTGNTALRASIGTTQRWERHLSRHRSACRTATRWGPFTRSIYPVWSGGRCGCRVPLVFGFAEVVVDPARPDEQGVR